MSAHRTIPIAAPVLGDEEWHALREPLESGWLTQGPKVAAFEAAFAERHGVDARAGRPRPARPRCTCASPRSAIGPGDEVIVPAFTWVATANVVVYCGATPVFADVDRRHVQPRRRRRRAARSPGARERSSPSTSSGCAPTSTRCAPRCRRASRSSRMPPAPPAPPTGATRPEALGDIAAFSFHPRKSITTGEGGMVTTGDARARGDRRPAPKPRRLDLRGAAPRRRRAVPAPGVRRHRLQLPHERPAGGCRARPAAQARRASSTSATRSPSATRTRSPTSRLADAPRATGRRPPRLAVLRRRWSTDDAPAQARRDPAPRSTSWASARGPGRTR